MAASPFSIFPTANHQWGQSEMKQMVDYIRYIRNAVSLASLHSSASLFEGLAEDFKAYIQKAFTLGLLQGPVDLYSSQLDSEPTWRLLSLPSPFAVWTNVLK